MKRGSDTKVDTTGANYNRKVDFWQLLSFIVAYTVFKMKHSTMFFLFIKKLTSH